MMKRLFLLLAFLFVSLSFLWADNDIFGVPKISSANELVGYIVIPQKGLSGGYDVIKKQYPDTIWRKRVSNPKEGRHYTLDYEYRQPIVGNRFKVIQVDDDIRKGHPGFVLESVSDGTLIKCEALTLSSFDKFELVEISEQLTASNKGKTFYTVASNYKLSDYKPIIIERLQVFFSFLYSGKDPIIKVNARYDSGEEYSFSNEFTKSIPIISESEYQTLVEQNHIRLLTSGRYSLYLSDVAKPQGTKHAKGNITNLEGNRFKYEDSFLAFDVQVTDKQFEFILTNKTSNSFKINWDEALFVDENNMSQRVIHKGVRLIDRSQPQAPSIVSGGTNCEELLIPADNIEYSSYSKEWYKKNLIPANSTKGRFQEDARVQIILPIETGGKKYEYTFLFGFLFEYSHPDYREEYFRTHPEEQDN